LTRLPSETLPVFSVTPCGFRQSPDRWWRRRRRRALISSRPKRARRGRNFGSQRLSYGERHLFRTAKAQLNVFEKEEQGLGRNSDFSPWNEQRWMPCPKQKERRDKQSRTVSANCQGVVVVSQPSHASALHVPFLSEKFSLKSEPLRQQSPSADKGNHIANDYPQGNEI
jgi:hypothetical protein